MQKIKIDFDYNYVLGCNKSFFIDSNKVFPIINLVSFKKENSSSIDLDFNELLNTIKEKQFDYINGLEIVELKNNRFALVDFYHREITNFCVFSLWKEEENLFCLLENYYQTSKLQNHFDFDYYLSFLISNFKNVIFDNIFINQKRTNVNKDILAANLFDFIRNFLKKFPCFKFYEMNFKNQKNILKDEFYCYEVLNLLDYDFCFEDDNRKLLFSMKI